MLTRSASSLVGGRHVVCQQNALRWAVVGRRFYSEEPNVEDYGDIPLNLKKHRASPDAGLSLKNVAGVPNPKRERPKAPADSKSSEQDAAQRTKRQIPRATSFMGLSIDSRSGQKKPTYGGKNSPRQTGNYTPPQSGETGVESRLSSRLARLRAPNQDGTGLTFEQIVQEAMEGSTSPVIQPVALQKKPQKQKQRPPHSPHSPRPPRPQAQDGQRNANFKRRNDSEQRDQKRPHAKGPHQKHDRKRENREPRMRQGDQELKAQKAAPPALEGLRVPTGPNIQITTDLTELFGVSPSPTKGAPSSKRTLPAGPIPVEVTGIAGERTTRFLERVAGDYSRYVMQPGPQPKPVDAARFAELTLVRHPQVQPKHRENMLGVIGKLTARMNKGAQARA